jgi:hypothetical protein
MALQCCLGSGLPGLEADLTLASQAHLVPITRRPVRRSNVALAQGFLDWKQIWASPVRLSVTVGADQTTAIKALQCCLGSGLPGLEADLGLASQALRNSGCRSNDGH